MLVTAPRPYLIALCLTNKSYDMDKTTKIFTLFIGFLTVFVFTKEMSLSLIIAFWLFFLLFSLSHQLFLFFSIFPLGYYLIFKTISFTHIVIMVILGLLLAVIPKFKEKKKSLKVSFWRDTKIISAIFIALFFLSVLIFSIHLYQNQQLFKTQASKEKPAKKVIIYLQQATDNNKQ